MNSVLILLMSGLLLMNTGARTKDKDMNGLMWTNYTDGIRQAASTNKKVLIDVYTDWCGWCKKMDSDTYSDENVKSYLSEKYVLVKLNAESDAKEMVDTSEVTDAQLAAAFKVTGYPTTIFLQSDGEPITAAPGYLKPDQFLQVLKYIGDDYYKKMEFRDYLKSQGTDGK